MSKLSTQMGTEPRSQRLTSSKSESFHLLLTALSQETEKKHIMMIEPEANSNLIPVKTWLKVQKKDSSNLVVVEES